MHLIRVEPFGDGWALSLDGVAEPQIFRSGRAAEKAARAMGERLARAGDTSEISIFLRDGSRAAHFVCAPQRPDGRDAGGLRPT